MSSKSSYIEIPTPGLIMQGDEIFESSGDGIHAFRGTDGRRLALALSSVPYKNPGDDGDLQTREGTFLTQEGTFLTQEGTLPAQESACILNLEIPASSFQNYQK